MFTMDKQPRRCDAHANALTAAIVFATQIIVFLTLPGEAAASVVKTCSAATTPEGLYGGHFGTLKSDVDGYGTIDTRAFHSPKENCRWEILCPDDRNGALFFTVKGNLGAQASVTVTSPTGSVVHTTTSNAEHLEFSGEGVVPLDASLGGENRVVVTFESDSGRVPGYGFDFEYRCRPSKCTSDTASRTLTTVTGTLGTDADGAGPKLYRGGEDCKWEIECPVGYREGGIQVMVAGDTRETKLTLEPANGVSWEGNLNSTQPNKLLNFFDSWKLDVFFRPVTSGRGFDLKWRCRPSQCMTKSIVTQRGPAAGRIVHGFKTRSGNEPFVTYAPGQRCRQLITCPAGTQYIAYTIFARQDGPVTLRVGNATVPHPSYNIHYDEVQTDVLPQDSLEIVAESTLSLNYAVMAYEIDYACHSSSCKALVPTVLPLNASDPLLVTPSRPGYFNRQDDWFDFSSSRKSDCRWRLDPCGPGYGRKSYVYFNTYRSGTQLSLNSVGQAELTLNKNNDGRYVHWSSGEKQLDLSIEGNLTSFYMKWTCALNCSPGASNSSCWDGLTEHHRTNDSWSYSRSSVTRTLTSTDVSFWQMIARRLFRFFFFSCRH